MRLEADFELVKCIPGLIDLSEIQLYQSHLCLQFVIGNFYLAVTDCPLQVVLLCNHPVKHPHKKEDMDL